MADADYLRGWADGRNVAAAALVGVVAAELGHDHPLVDRIVERLGSIQPPRREALPQTRASLGDCSLKDYQPPAS